MMQIKHAVYLEKGKERNSIQYFNTTNCFLILQIDGEFSLENDEQIIQKLGQSIITKDVNNLADFEHILTQAIKDLNLPANLSLAAGYAKGEIFYLKTIGAGQIYLKRGRDFAKIIDGGQSASGYSKEGDIYTLTTENFVNLLSEQRVKKILDNKDPSEIVNKINISPEPEEGLIAFFVSFNKKTYEDHFFKEKGIPKEYSSPGVKQVSVPKSLKNPLSGLFLNWQEFKNKSGNKNIITITAVALIFVIFVWSVVLGYQRRSEAEAQRAIKSSREIINQKLSQSEDVAFLNLSRAQVLLAESRSELTSLKSRLGDKYKKNVEEIDNLIKTKEGQIMKKEDKSPEEFFDLNVDNKDASGTKLGGDGDQLAILDKTNSTIYILSLSKKSLDKEGFSKIKLASLVNISDSDIFFFVSGEGVYKISDDKTSKIIDNDSDWGNIADLAIYNKNIYLLDSSYGQIYKYAVTDEGYSKKSSYIKEDSLNGLSRNSSIAIDSSIYLFLEDNILKFSGGLREGFRTEFPEEVKITKVMTNKDEEKLYAWDKEKGSIYVMEKNGTYERQINSSFLSKAVDVLVHSNKAYILIKNKIYSLDLN